LLRGGATPSNSHGAIDQQTQDFPRQQVTVDLLVEVPVEHEVETVECRRAPAPQRQRIVRREPHHRSEVYRRDDDQRVFFREFILR